MIRTAVVILNYNGENLFDRFLPSVIQHSTDASIFVIDNASTDGSVTLLQSKYPSVGIIQLDRNYGFCGGYNRGLLKINALHYVLLNSDVEVTSDWLAPMVGLLDRDPDIAAVQPKILSWHQRGKFEYAGAGGGFVDLLGYPFCRGRLFQALEDDDGQYNDTREVFWATGACMIIRASVFHTFKGFDEDFFAHMEEIDLCWKIQRTPAKVFYCGESTVFHLGAGTLGYNSPRKTYLNFRNGLSLIYKHLDRGELLYKLPLRLILDWLASLVFLVRGQWKHFTAVWSAHKDFLGSLKTQLRKRRALHREYPWYSRKQIYARSIVVAYFLAGKKKISSPK